MHRILLTAQNRAAVLSGLRCQAPCSLFCLLQVLSISVGYFLWDLWVCVHYRWPIAFWGHGICCFAVMYSGLHPFFHQQV